MNFRDIFAGITNPNYVMQEIETEFDRERIPADKLAERRNYNFRNNLADAILKSNKFNVESEQEDPEYGDPRNIRHRAEVFVMTREEIRRMVQNISYHSQAEILSFLAKVGSDLRDSATESNEKPST